MKASLQELMDPGWVVGASTTTTLRGFEVSMDALEEGGTVRVKASGVATKTRPYIRSKWMVEVHLSFISNEDTKLIGRLLGPLSPVREWFENLMAHVKDVPIFRDTGDRRSSTTDCGSKITVARPTKHCVDFYFKLEARTVEDACEMVKRIAPFVSAPLTPPRIGEAWASDWMIQNRMAARDALSSA